MLMQAPYQAMFASYPAMTVNLLQKLLIKSGIQSTAASALLHCYVKLQTCRDHAQKPDLLSL